MSRSALFIALAGISLCIPRQASAAVDLPGITVLSAGFDAAAWENRGSGRYRIFDLTKEGPKVTIPEMQKEFTTPALVTVTTDGPATRRAEDTCSNVAATFREFLHTYQESVSLSVGVKSGDFSLGLHREVDEIYHATTDKRQAIGTSTSWWGMYQVSLPPAFLLLNSLDTSFVQTRDALKAIGTPTSDAQQSIFNQVITAYGTHFMPSAIVGARATMHTFVNNTFHSEFSEKTVTSQISIGFQYKKLSMSLDEKAKDYAKEVMKEFANATHDHMEFQPDISQTPGEAPWLTWEAAAKEKPVVVNMTASPLSDLFFDMPEVQAHMQKTIDFYTLNGKTGSLSEVLAPPSAVSLLLASGHAEAPSRVPGLSVVGCGFDAPSLTNKACLFDTPSLPDSETLWSNPSYPSIEYSVPTGFFVESTPESMMLNGTLVFETLDDYLAHSHWVETHSSSGFLGFGGKKEKKTTDDLYRNFYAHRYALALTMRQIGWFSLSVAQFPQPPLSPLFKAALEALPETYDPEDTVSVQMFEQFFGAFGTHVVTKAHMGGSVWAQDWFESCLIKIYSDTCINQEIRRRYDPFGIAHKSTDRHQCDKRLVSDYEKYSSQHYEMLGGTEKVPLDKWEQWALTVKHAPKPVSMHTVPIHHILYGPAMESKRAALEAATLAFLHSSEAQKKQTIEELERVRPPPAPVCDRDTDHDPLHPGKFFSPSPALSLSTQTPDLPSEDNSTKPAVTAPDALSADPRVALCPIVGYNGAFCPGGDPPAPSPSLKALFGDAADANARLPRGVGITLDVSTGEIKLPAAELSGAASVWSDPVTGKAYDVPSGVSLDSNVTAYSQPSVRVFKTEEELADVWEAGYQQGTWLGGSFGLSAGLLKLYNEFFSKRQSTSINQHPVAVYKLDLVAGWEKALNAYAKQALQALPETLDTHTYDLFFETWGTHVATSTLVGGMAEMQIAFKECIWGSPFLSGGLTPLQMEQFLAAELTKTPVSDAYYTARRQISVDHRLGGNPEVVDASEWRKTVGANPALLRVFSHTEWATVAEASGAVSAAVVNNLRVAVKTRLETAEAERKKERETVKAQRLAELQGPRTVTAVVAHGRRGGIVPQMNIGGKVQLKGFADCPEGLPSAQADAQCSTGVNIESWNTFHLVKPLRYERNAQGQMRSSRCFDLNPANRQCIDHFGQWVDIGCSLQPFANNNPRDFHAPVPDKTVIGMVCADCEPMATNFAADATLKCACPGYALTETNAAPVLRSLPPIAPEEPILPPASVTSLRGTRRFSDETHIAEQPSESAEPDMEQSTSGLLKTAAPLFRTETDRETDGESPVIKWEIPDYKQCDEQWGCFPYAGHEGRSSCSETSCEGDKGEWKNNICVSGCGITTTAMMLSHYRFTRQISTSRDSVLPPEVASFFVQRGYRDDSHGFKGVFNVRGATCNGVSWDAICAAARSEKLSCQTTQLLDKAPKWLKAGPLIAHVRRRPGAEKGSCKFTNAGHYIALTGIVSLDKNDIRKTVFSVQDPNSTETERYVGTGSELIDDCAFAGLVRIFDPSSASEEAQEVEQVEEPAWGEEEKRVVQKQREAKEVLLVA
uniref:MACPF domain-containing protein n=1 Tax=Chromera velia CCMP2878 TaxID=1169474 RepID=A0A0G4FGM9_9ALVE|eukprot:Cvel_16732.t1-p1 / transcript=Cvel_16732.t1 / gene=Cvel_16732 / organism=Chromera_velia_CCMP2878 / gene_product=hypothetical protein / transcript_product=hypothetical protein / location=Cvel_scaffold1301:37291-42971(+) / protein_length=1583 / sequence_SO=supercontig / SO=protein_coding / is_pseudo=false